jgi:hypothetical protein
MLDPEVYLRLFTLSPGRRLVFPCLDNGHLALSICRNHFARNNAGRNIFELKPEHPDIELFFDAINASCQAGFAQTIAFLEDLAALPGPLHFHLHDAHPSSTLSRWHVSDHLGFQQKIRLPFSRHGSCLASGIYGIRGIKKLINTIMALKKPQQLSFMIEVHPQPGRSPLGVHSPVFSHWQDLTNAEQVNHWLDLLLANADLVREIIFENQQQLL